MAQRKIKTEWEPTGAPAPGARESSIAVQSPARLLQQLLDERKDVMPDPQVERWSQRRALAFIVASSSALWLAILVAGAQAAKFIA